VFNVVLGSADPAELVVALGTNHVVAPTGFFLYDEPALGAIGYAARVQTLEVLLHGLIHLASAILAKVVIQATAHANLIFAPLALAVVRILTIEKAIYLLLEFVVETFFFHTLPLGVIFHIAICKNNLILKLLNLSL
jgi:hypothetical protein